VRSDTERLADLAEALERLGRYTSITEDDLARDDLVQTWVVHHLQIAGEAARGLSEDFINAHPEVPWSDIVGMRHVLVHHYFGIDLDAVWQALHDDVPELRAQVEAFLSEFSADDE
jgi:uncharacterized protein with HEPN domain